MTGLMVSESYVNETKGYRFGDSGWFEAYTDDRGELFRSMQQEYGRCTGAMYVDVENAPPRRIGWVFEKRMLYEDARPTHTSHAGNPQYAEDSYYVRSVWVHVEESREEITCPTCHQEVPA